MIDGPTEVTDLDKTEENRELVRSFVDEVIINGQLDRLEHYIDAEGYTEHNPHMSDGLSALRSALAETDSHGKRKIQYNRLHRLLAEGNFLLSVSEGFRDGVHSSFYDLFRVADGKIVEHWDTTDAIPPRTEWKNENGKF
jgi:predicted SnoaL-like aldol condensation-catalyzing enzyme